MKIGTLRIIHKFELPSFCHDNDQIFRFRLVRPRFASEVSPTIRNVNQERPISERCF